MMIFSCAFDELDYYDEHCKIISTRKKSLENYLQPSSVGCSEDWDLLFSWRLFPNYFKITAAKIEICLLHSVHFHEKIDIMNQSCARFTQRYLKSFMKLEVLFSALVSSWLKYDMIKCEYHLILPQPRATSLFKERFHQNQSMRF